MRKFNVGDKVQVTGDYRQKECGVISKICSLFILVKFDDLNYNTAFKYKDLTLNLSEYEIYQSLCEPDIEE